MILLPLLLTACAPSAPSFIPAAADAAKECESDEQCVIVQESWCKTIQAIPKAKEAEWRKLDLEHRAKAATERQECEPGSSMSQEIFIPACLHGRCVAVLHY